MENPKKDLSGLLDLQMELAARQSALEDSLNVVEQQLNAVGITIALMRNGHHLDAQEMIKPAQAPVILIDRRPDIDVKGMTQLKALIALASNWNGRFRIVDARKVLEKAGVMKRSKNGYNMLYNVVVKSGKFERCGPGEYKLIEIA
jgi:hypothetical protein